MFLESRKTAILSLIVMTVLTLYLTSLDNKISTDENTVYKLFLTFDSTLFVSIIKGWGVQGIASFSRYLCADIVFSLSYMIALPSATALMFAQYRLITSNREENGVIDAQIKKRNFFMLLPVLAAIFNVSSDFILLSNFNNDSISSIEVALSGSFQVFKMSFLVISVSYVIYLLLMRRRLLRTLK